MKQFTLFLVIVILFLLPVFSIAATITSGANGNWTNTATWQGGVVPGVNDDVIIANGHTVNVNNNRTINSITINGNGVININSTRTLTVISNFAMNGTSSITGNGTDRQISIGGNLTISGNSIIQNIALSVIGNTTINGTLTFNTANTATKTFNHFIVNGTFNNTSVNVPITISGNMENNGTFNQGTGRVTFTGGNTTVSGSAAVTTFDGGITVNKNSATDQVEFLSVIAMNPTSAATELIPTRGIFKLSSASTITPFFLNKNTVPNPDPHYDVPANGTLWSNHPDAVMNSRVTDHPGSSWSIQGTLRVTTGTINVGSKANDHLAPRAGSTILIEGGNLNVTGRISQFDENFTYTMTGGTLTVATIGNNSIGERAPFNMPLTTQVFNMSGGTIIIQNPGAPGTENTGYMNKSTTGTGMTGGTIQIGNNLTDPNSIIEIESTRPINNLVINSANVTARVMNNNHVIRNNVTIADGRLDIGTDGRDLTVGGNWTNNSSITDPFIEGTRTVTFNGSSMQTISNTGNANGTRFYNLIINNSSGVSPGITTNSNVFVQNTFTMTQGNVNLNSNTLTLGTAANSAGTLTHAAGWLYGGTFTRWMRTTALTLTNNRGLFPMGTAEEDYRPVWLGYSPALTTGGTVSVTHNASYPSDHTPVAYHDASWGEDIEGVSTSSWTISTANNFNPSGNNLSLRYGGTGMDVFVLSDLNASLGGSAVGNFAAATSSNVPLEVNRTGLSRTNLNNTWYVGTRDVDQSPLPVELIKFSAEAGNYQTYLYWSTASEINSAYFTIERSVDGLTFKSVGTIQASGNSNQLLNYDFSDSNPHQGISYYRLKQTDLNGDVYYSRLVVINHTYGTSFDIYPNPANHQVHIITDANKNYLISLYNAVGQEISLTFSSEQSTIDISNLPEGVYILEVYDGSATERHKLVVKH